MGARLGAIALLALLVRAIVPAGYMLAYADTGRFLTVEMCEGHAAKVVDLDTGEQVDPSGLPGKADDKSKSAPCVFASTASVATPVAIAEPVEFFTTRNVAFGVNLNVSPGRGIAAPPPPATGPPASL